LIGALALAFANAGQASARHHQAKPTFKCEGPQFTVFDNTNAAGIQNNASPPTFTTNGAICVTHVRTYHYNGGRGAKPGTLTLRRVSGPAGLPATVGPFQAQGGGSPKGVDWLANVSTSPPRVIDGTYRCIDSDPRTWSHNTDSHGGFCLVKGVSAVQTGGPGQFKTGGPPPQAKCTLPSGPGYQVNMTLSATTGPAPLTVTFLLCQNVSASASSIQWSFTADEKTNLDAMSCTGGQNGGPCAPPPTKITYTYTKPGTYIAEFRVDDQSFSGAFVATKVIVN
jgi:hypothetical protein